MGNSIHKLGVRALASLGSLLAAGPLAVHAGAQATGQGPGSPEAGGQPAVNDEPGAPAAAKPMGYAPRTERERFLEQRYGDHHVAVVGDEIITRSDVLTHLARADPQDDPTAGIEGLTDMQRLEARYLAALEELLDAKLKTQGGENLGFDPELIERAANSAFQNQIERWGGQQKATEVLKGMNFTPTRLKEYYRDRMLGQSWEATMTGDGPGPTGRAIQDAYNRPGELFARYRELASSRRPDDQEKVGKTEGKVTIQEFLMAVRSPEKVAESEQFVATLKANVAEGILTFEQAVNQYAAPNFRGEASFTRNAPAAPLGKALVRKHPGYEASIAKFLSSPSAGDLSEVMPIIINGRTEAFGLYRVVESAAPTALTPFVDLQLQLRLEKELRDAQSELRVDRGLAELVRSTYVAPLDLRRELLRRGTRPPKRTQRDENGQGGQQQPR